MTRGNNKGSNWYALRRQEENRRASFEEKLRALDLELARWPERAIASGVRARLARHFAFYSATDFGNARRR